MKILLLLLMGVAARASPFLVSDPYPANVDPVLVPVSFRVNGLPGGTVSSPAFQQTDGTLILHLDLANLPNGSYTVTADAINGTGGDSGPSLPFSFVRGVIAIPGNLRISPI